MINFIFFFSLEKIENKTFSKKVETQSEYSTIRKIQGIGFSSINEFNQGR